MTDGQASQHQVEDFYGCYLLVCENPRYRGRTYIGYTRDPNRRIRQHNTGKHAGGAWRTSGKGPWAMVLIIHGFPNDIAALRFEWAWQHPERSRRLRSLSGKTRNESAYQYRLRIVETMLRTGPWCRLPLTIRWLIQEYRRDFSPNAQPPLHMGLAYGPVKAVNKFAEKKKQEINDAVADIPELDSRCAVCRKRLVDEDDSLCCLHRCGATSHMICLAKHYLRSTPHYVLPVEGACPQCGANALWGDLIRFKKGCYQNITEVSDGEHWADELSSQAVT